MFDKNNLLSRQAHIFSNWNLNIPVLIFWIGFVWSNLTYTLYKTWFNKIITVDYDIIEEHNLMNQYFHKKYLWKNKAESIAEQLSKETPLDDQIIFWYNDKLENYIKNTWINNWNIVFITVDSLKTRLIFLQHIIKNFNELKDTIFVFVWTSWDVLMINIFLWDKNKLIQFYNQLKDSYKKKTFEEWLCWEKSAFYLWNLISWLVLWELRLIFNNQLKQYSKTIFYLNKLWTISMST